MQQTAVERMNFHQPERTLPNRPFGPAAAVTATFEHQLHKALTNELNKQVAEAEAALQKQEEPTVERKPKRKRKAQS